MTRIRTHAKPDGTCLADGCKSYASGVETSWQSVEGLAVRADGLCKKHRAALEIELRERNAQGDKAQVLRLADYERDPETGRVFKK